MTTRSWRVTVIGVDLPDDLGDQIQEWLDEHVPDAIVEVRRTIISAHSSSDGRKNCE